MTKCECRHTERQHWAWMDDGNGRDGSPCKVCDCNDYDPLTMADCGHKCCDERGNPHHDHWLDAAECPRCV